MENEKKISVLDDILLKLKSIGPRIEYENKLIVLVLGKDKFEDLIDSSINTSMQSLSALSKNELLLKVNIAGYSCLLVNHPINGFFEIRAF